MKTMIRNIAGFTLVEVVVVVTIISILVTIGSMSYSDARAQARDDVRKTELKNLQLAIELYRAQNGSYPAMGCGTVVPDGQTLFRPTGEYAGGGSAPGWGDDCTTYIAGLSPDFIAELPQDPSFTTTVQRAEGRAYIYITNTSRTAYKLMAHGTVEQKRLNNTDFSQEFARCPYQCSINGATDYCDSVQATIYAVYSAGAECW